jgi:hypothetical protein
VIPLKTCRRRVFFFFGALFLAAVLAVPYRETHVTVTQEGRRASFAKKTTTIAEGYMFLPRFLDRNGDWSSAYTREELAVTLRTTLYAAEIGAVFLLGILDYLFFCLRRPRKRSGVERSGVAPTGR